MTHQSPLASSSKLLLLRVGVTAYWRQFLTRFLHDCPRLLTHPEITPEEVEEAVSIKRMDSGLLSLQLVDISLLGVFVHGQPSVRSAIRRLLKMRSASVSQLITVAQDYADNLGDTKDSMTHEKSRVLNLIRGANEHLA
ncbi:unnamed protein product [Schistocephalus solidus]|uniref:Uncharacterized protein n=1 Tax=Schistocephalus solidus TaxID=70667 RepID=A0A183T8K8_SCHSO|nr:unnamed protein product [Schistocephalus solidus]